MADFIHSRKYLDGGNIVEVDCDTQCNVMLLTDSEFSKYKSRRSFHYYGGHYKYFPASISAPHSGDWNIVIDLGGGRANIKYSIRVIK